MKLFYCMLVFLMVFAANIYAKPPQKQISPTGIDPNPNELSHDEIDPTDVYAIPLDMSEEELEQEMETLNEMERAYKEKHHN